MLTVLFVVAALAAAYLFFCAVDGQCVASREIGSYLRYEYNVTNTRPTLAQLRNI